MPTIMIPGGKYKLSHKVTAVYDQFTDTVTLASSKESRTFLKADFDRLQREDYDAIDRICYDLTFRSNHPTRGRSQEIFDEKSLQRQVQTELLENSAALRRRPPLIINTLPPYPRLINRKLLLLL